jgi:y4mF family transcriptional regulator
MHFLPTGREGLGSKMVDPHEHAETAAALGAAVRRRRRELGLTQHQLADLASVSARFLHSLEHGKATVRLREVMAVLGVLGLDLDVVPGRGTITERDAARPDEDRRRV